MALLAIVNGASAGGRTGKRWPQIAAALGDAGVDFEVAFTEGPGHASELVVEALGRGVATIAACGGDGTLNEVVNGLIDERGVARSPRAVLALLPSGTGGDFRRTLGIDPDPRAAAAVIAGGNVRPIDAGLIEFADGSPTRRFVNIASCGVGYEVDRRINSLRFKPGRLAYALVSAWSILTYPPAPARVSVDGEVVTGSFLWIALANGRYFGGGMMAAPDADPSDGQLDVVLSSDGGMRALLGSRHIYSGAHIGRPGVQHLRGARIEITPTSDARIGFDIDGEPLGQTPATITALPHPLTILTP